MDDPEIIEVSTGVKFSLKKPSLWLLMALDEQFDKSAPPVPQTERENGRMEDNPNAPSYKAALDRHMAKKAQRVYELAIASGTTVVEVPEGFYGIEDKAWEAVPRFVGVEIAADGLDRYIQWVKFHACPDPNDILLLLTPVMKLIGTNEEEVQDALNRFRDNKGGSTNNRPPDKSGRGHRNKAKSTRAKPGAAV